MQTKSFFTKTRWLVTIILTAFSIGHMWGTRTTNVTIHAASGTSHYAYVNSWTNGTQYDQVVLCDSIKANRIGTGNNGKYYSDWRFYTSGSTSGSFSIDAYEGARLKSVTFTYTVSKSGALYLGSTKLSSGTAQSISGTSATFTTKNTNSSTNGQVRLTVISVTYYPQTVVTLNANGGSANKTATFSYDETAYTSFTAVTRSGYTCTGYWTDASGGTKILNADGSRAANEAGWWTSNKWSKDAAEATLYAQWESDAACSDDVAIGTASLNGSFLWITKFCMRQLRFLRHFMAHHLSIVRDKLETS